MVKHTWSLTERLAAGIGLSVFILGLILGIVGYSILSSLFENNLKERAESQARQLALFAADAILVYDYATLERYATALANEPGILAVDVKRDDGEQLAQAGLALIPKDQSSIKVTQALQIGRSDIGVVNLTVDRSEMENTVQRIAIIGLLYLLLLIAILFWTLKRFVDNELIRPIQQLAQAASPLSSQQCPDPSTLPDELAKLADTFCAQRDAINAHLTERDNAELLARNATERLTREQRLAMVGQIAAGVAHNLNTPLGSIKGFAQLLIERLDKPEQITHAKHIVEQVKFCAETVGNLLTAVRPPEVERRAFNLYKQVIGVIELMQPLLRDRGMIIKAPDKIDNNQAYETTGDPGAVEQILFNLFTNAVQANASILTIRLLDDIKNKTLSLEIHDNGLGISDNLRDKLFDPFITDKAPGHGTGLGLYLSRQLAEGMGAELDIAETGNIQGACFILRFGKNEGAND